MRRQYINIPPHGQSLESIGINMEKDNTIVRSIASVDVRQRSGDGYVNATQLLKAHFTLTGETRHIKDWVKTDRAKAYLKVVSKRGGISTFDLIQTKPGKNGGSWIHPDLAVPFATWLSVEFELQVSDWVQEWMRTGVNPVQKQLSKSEIIASLLPSEPLEWECRYHPNFWEHLYRLNGFKQGNPACANWINRFVYGYFPQEIRDRLNEINPLIDGKRKNLQHTHFDGALLKSLEQHLATVNTLMSVSASAKEFERLMDAKFRGVYQLQIWSKINA